MNAYMLIRGNVCAQHLANVRTSLVVKHPVKGHELITKDCAPYICDFYTDFFKVGLCFCLLLCR